MSDQTQDPKARLREMYADAIAGWIPSEIRMRLRDFDALLAQVPDAGAVELNDQMWKSYERVFNNLICPQEVDRHKAAIQAVLNVVGAEVERARRELDTICDGVREGRIEMGMLAMWREDADKVERWMGGAKSTFDRRTLDLVTAVRHLTAEVERLYAAPAVSRPAEARGDDGPFFPDAEETARKLMCDDTVPVDDVKPMARALLDYSTRLHRLAVQRIESARPAPLPEVTEPQPVAYVFRHDGMRCVLLTEDCKPWHIANGTPLRAYAQRVRETEEE